MQLVKSQDAILGETTSMQRSYEYRSLQMRWNRQAKPDIQH